MTQPDRRTLRNLAHRFGRLAGWRRWLAVLFLGALSAFALPPWNWFVLIVPGFFGLLLAIGAAGRARSAFAAGWWFGVGHFAVGFYWVAHAFLVDAATYGLLAPVAIAALAAGLALFPGTVALLSWLVEQRLDLSTTGRILMFAGLWTVSEWIRGWAFTGLPWNLIGTVWDGSDAMVQFAGFGGVYLLGLVTLIAATCLLAVIEEAPVVRRWGPVAVGFGLLALVFAAGHWRLSAAEPAWVDGVRLRLVQPNIPQHLKWKADLRATHVKTQIELSRGPAKPGNAPTHIIWAETAVPFNLSHDPPLIRLLGSVAPKGGHLITGAPRGELGGEGGPAYWNSLHVIDDGGTLHATYDKVHLVPFGEYVPIRSVFGFSKLTAGRVDFSPGTGSPVLDIPGLPPVAPLICYEVIFPAEVTALGPRPAWLLNVTNDAWFGRSAGPYQHLAAARLRSIEMGIPLVRVANTGISVVTDPYGRVIDRLELGRQGTLDSRLPERLSSAPPYGRWGDWITAGVLIFILAFSLAFRRTAGGRPRMTGPT